MQPLKGLTVVTLEHAIAAPFATRQLADLGARVIKIERPGVGDFARGYDARVRGLASHFVWANRSKESLTLDVKHPEAAALLQRGQTHRGQHIEISMLEALGEWMSYPMYYAFEGAEPPPRTGASHATIYPYGPFPTGDGKTVMLGLQNEREWEAFCTQVLRQPALAKDPRFAGNARRSAERTALRALIVEAFSALSAAEVLARLDEAQIANAQVNTMHELWQHPQLAARGRWRQVDSPAGPLPALLPPGTWDEGPRMDPVPALGEHTEAILRELGVSAAAIGELRSAEAI